MTIKDLLPSVWRKDISPERRESDHPFDSLQQDMNRLFNDFFRGFDVAPFGASADRFGVFSPSVDIREDDKEINVKAELPGLDEKDVEVLLTDNSLTIKGEKKEDKEDKGKNYYRMERSYGSFRRVIALPQGLDPDKAKADFKNGVLSISLPKTEDASKNARKISIKKS
jgi:HSP20 family protein